MQAQERIHAAELELHRWSRSMLVLRGIIAALLGLSALAFPSRTLAGVVAFVAAYFLIDGGFTVVSGFIHLFRDNRGAWPYFIEGGLSLAVGLSPWGDRSRSRWGPVPDRGALPDRGCHRDHGGQILLA